MSHFMLRPKAEQDLERIWHYTLDTWGDQQADTYIRQLNERFHMLADDPGIGRDCEYIRPAYRKYAVGQHVIFYRAVSDDAIEIVRILHERMDVERDLFE